MIPRGGDLVVKKNEEETTKEKRIQLSRYYDYSNHRLYESEKEYEERVEESLILSLSNPRYDCRLCDYYIWSKKEIIEHYRKEHQFNRILPNHKDKFEPEYIILKKIIEKCIYQRSRYFQVTNKELYLEVLKKLGENASFKENQVRYILDKYKLTLRGKREKKRIKYAKGGARAYNINVSDLKNAVFESEFDDLKIKLGLITHKDLIPLTEKKQKSKNNDEEVEESETLRGLSDIEDYYKLGEDLDSL